MVVDITKRLVYYEAMNQNQCPICLKWYVSEDTNRRFIERLRVAAYKAVGIKTPKEDLESWYEMKNGDYCCQDCMESHQESEISRYEGYLESKAGDLNE